MILKKNTYIITLLIIGTILVFSSCKSYKDNLTPFPKLSLENATVSMPQNPGEVFNLDSLFRVPYGGNVKLTFTVMAEGGIQQVDYKVTGNKNAYAVNFQDELIVTNTVPFDWGGLISVTKGFDSEDNFTFSLIIPNDTAKTTVTVQVTDKNNLSSYISHTLLPVIEGPQKKNVRLFSPNASIADAGGAAELKMFLASSTTLTYDSVAAKLNSDMIDLSFADSSGTPIIVSPEARMKSTNMENGALDLKNSLKTIFTESPSGFIPAVTNIFTVDFKGAPSYIQVSAGKTYLYENSAGGRGVIKVNSIDAGLISGESNASIDFDYILYIPLQTP